MWYIFCLSLGAVLGALAVGFARGSSHDEDCRSCKAYYSAREDELLKKIHGLKSTQGRMAQELQIMAFRNSGYNAR